MPSGVYERQPTGLAERLWRHVRKGEGCWEWTGAHTSAGYGKLTLGPRGAGHIRAHRASWELAHGPIPDGLWVLHRCDNPPCVRPDHLFLGTRADNMRDCVDKGRINTTAARAERARRRLARAGGATA